MGSAPTSTHSWRTTTTWDLIMIGAAITSGAHNGASAGFDEWDTKEENWVPGRGGFIGANGAGATPKVINAGVSGTFSAARVCRAVLSVVTPWLPSPSRATGSKLLARRRLALQRNAAPRRAPETQ